MEDHKLKIIHKALQGNKDAIEFINHLSFIARAWDDIIDKDKGIDDDRINRAFWIALVEIPQNPFYQQYLFQLTPLLRDYINSWLDANNMEQGASDNNKHVAFVLRDLIGNIVMQCAYLIGGYDWMRTVSPWVRSFQFEEKFDQYMEGLTHGNV
uniref:Uncharacterized protein n=1 Tax=viral metagenome TaxID=1070528 RepID=A0A6M3LJC3_9ZZZZ